MTIRPLLSDVDGTVVRSDRSLLDASTAVVQHVEHESRTVRFEPTAVDELEETEAVAKLIGASDDHDAMAGRSFNANDEVQRSARRAGTTSDDDGFANTVERLILGPAGVRHGSRNHMFLRTIGV